MLLNRIPLEDELGDVLDKAIRHAGLTEAEVAERARVPSARIRDAIDYRSDLTAEELTRLAATLRLNEVGLCALGQGRYPQPEIGPLPFCIRPLRMPHGIGVTNAYLISECGADSGLLFDVGPDLGSLEQGWPRSIHSIDAVFLTHVEGEHTGALCDVVARFGLTVAFVPAGAAAVCSRALPEGEAQAFGAFDVQAFNTPGHAAAHNCYLVRSRLGPSDRGVLISGDLVFAGSAGGGYFCHRQLQANLRRILEAVPPETVIAPGHGPLTTVENERRFNPFFA